MNDLKGRGSILSHDLIFTYLNFIKDHTETQSITMFKENEIGKLIVDAAISVHKELGPGLLESVYEIILAYKLEKSGLSVKRQVSVPIECYGVKFEEGFRADIIVENKVIIEIKSVETINKAHKKQVLTYLKLTKLKLGYLLNFGEALMKDGISRIINGEIN